MDIFHFNEIEMLAFLLVLVRVSVFFAMWPVFGVFAVPAFAKILTSLLVSILLFPTVAWKELGETLSSNMIIIMVVREVFVGLILVYIGRLLFFAVNICGQLVSMSLGLSSSEIYNPTMDSRASSIEQFQMMIASLVFLAWSGHHIFIKAMTESFTIIPLSSTFINSVSPETIANLVQQVMTVGIQLSGPVMAAIFFMNVALGLVGRAVPQINILITSLSANIAMGLLIVLISIPAFIFGFKYFVNVSGINLFAVLKTI
ncbi:MAG: flagellar biosynthetic protein FliR [Bdellovibrionales bacterium]|nr:flagellar biosynthetic protein FliR [Bdellovibrionales bacterium]